MRPARHRPIPDCRSRPGRYHNAPGCCVSRRTPPAAAALGEIAHPSAKRHLEAHLDDPDPDVRKNLRWALGRLGTG
jgi:hypothetical protein